MKASSHPNSGEDWECCHILPDASRPIVLANAMGNDNVTKSDDELIRPQQAKQMVEEHVLQTIQFLIIICRSWSNLVAKDDDQSSTLLPKLRTILD